jgi:actin-related protein
VDFTIRLRAEGTSETRAQAEAVKAVRTELEATIATAKAAGVTPKSVFDASKAKQKKGSGGPSGAEKEVANAEKQRLSLEKSQKREEESRKKADERKLEQKKKAIEREDKEIERAASKAQKELIKDEKDRQRKALQAEAEKIDPTLKQLSIVEKAKKNAAKKADEEMAARIDPSLKKLSATEKAKEKLFGKIGTGVMLAGAAAGAALVGVTAKLAPLALGYMGMARLSMISAQAGFNMRRLFMGTNPKPLLDALQRTGQLIDPRTFTGKTLGDLLTRSANGVFSLLAKAEPYARLFFKGMLYGALQVENAWLRLRIAIQPALNLLPPGIGLMTTFGAGALAVKAAFGLMGVGVALGVAKAATGLVSFGVSALAATGPLLPLAAAIVGVGLAISQLKELVDQWDDNSLTLIGKKLEEDFTSDEYKAKKQKAEDVDRQGRIGSKYGRGPLMMGGVGATGAPQTAPVPKGAEKQAATAGPPIGKNLGLGIVAGMKDTQAKVEAGGRDLVLAAEGGAKAEAIIRSPSEKWRRQIGRQLGAGAALGLEDSADRIDEAARAAVPGAPGMTATGGKRNGVTIGQIGPFYGMPEGGEQQVRRWVFDALDDAAERMGALA